MFLPPVEIRDVKQLPIFVWDDVLLPFVHWFDSIHVAEPKYARMLADIEFGDRLFGVTYDAMVDRKTGLPHVNSTGCIARLTECRTFASGDSNIKIEGLVRYRIVRYIETDKPYPVAEIEFFEEENERFHNAVRIEEQAQRAGELEELVEKTILTAQRLMNKVLRALGKKEDAQRLSAPDPVSFSFLMSALYIFNADDRLHLLNSPCPIHRLEFIARRLEESEARIDDNLQRREFLKPFLKLANNQSNPNLS